MTVSAWPRANRWLAIADNDTLGSRTHGKYGDLGD